MNNCTWKWGIDRSWGSWEWQRRHLLLAVSRTEVTWRRGAGHENTAASARRRSGDDGGGGAGRVGRRRTSPAISHCLWGLSSEPTLTERPSGSHRESCCDELPDHRFARAACDRSCVKSWADLLITLNRHWRIGSSGWVYWWLVIISSVKLLVNLQVILSFHSRYYPLFHHEFQIIATFRKSYVCSVFKNTFNLK